MHIRVLITWALPIGLIVPGAALADEATASADEGEAAIHGTFNTGEDVTRPRNQFQVRQRYERLPDTKGLKPEKWTTTLRADVWTGLGEEWRLYGRIDAPLVYSKDVTSSFNPNGHGRFGQGDLLTEIAIIAPPPTARLGYGAGVRAVWPTAGLNETGDGKYQIGPVAGVRLSLPEISPGSFVLPEVTYLNSVASRNGNRGRADINRTQHPAEGQRRPAGRLVRDRLCQRKHPDQLRRRRKAVHSFRSDGRQEAIRHFRRVVGVLALTVSR